LTLTVGKKYALTLCVWMANTLALVVRMPNAVAHLVRTVAIYLDTDRSEGDYALTLAARKVNAVPIFV
jgi:hypothetical protein